MGNKYRALVLSSGGLDSTTVLALAAAMHGKDSVVSVSFNYGQFHAIELKYSLIQSTRYAAKRIEVSLPTIGGSALTDRSVPLSRGKDPFRPGIPNSYVPGRNTILIAHAASIAEQLGIGLVYLGVNALDYSGYPDCRPEFIREFNGVLQLGLSSRVTLQTPLVLLKKSEIIRLGTALGVDYSLTSSCYDPTEAGACQVCDACQLRSRGFEEAGIPDPTGYRGVEV